MKQYKIDDKGRVRLSKKIVNMFNDKSSLRYDFNLKNSTFVLAQNNTLPHHH